MKTCFFLLNSIEYVFKMIIYYYYSVARIWSPCQQSYSHLMKLSKAFDQFQMNFIKTMNNNYSFAVPRLVAFCRCHLEL